MSEVSHIQSSTTVDGAAFLFDDPVPNTFASDDHYLTY